MNYGELIRIKRIEKKIRQEDLCFGICNISYLSRIENGHVIPHEEIFILLFERLGANFQEIKNHSVNIKKEIEHWRNSILRNDVETNDTDIKFNFSLETKIPPDVYIYFNTTIVFYFLKINDFINAELKLNNLNTLLSKNISDSDFIDIIRANIFYSISTKSYLDIIKLLENYQQRIKSLKDNVDKN